MHYKSATLPNFSLVWSNIPLALKSFSPHCRINNCIPRLLLIGRFIKMTEACRIPADEWNNYKDSLRSLYQNHDLNEVMVRAAEEFGFHARFVYHSY